MAARIERLFGPVDAVVHSAGTCNRKVDVQRPGMTSDYRLRSAIATIGLTALSAAALAQSDDDFLFPVQFTLYFAEDSPLYPFAVGHPCGKTVTLRANKLPVQVPTVRPVWAYELSGDGKIEARWAMPVDSTPLAVDGDKLTIHQLNDEEVVFVTSAVETGTTLDGPDCAALEDENKHRVECPANAQASEETRSYLCSEMTDTTNGKARIIAYPPICT